MTDTVEITIDVSGGVQLSADVQSPDEPAATVVFAHGSGSSRHSPRNRAVATTLNDAGLETVLLDLLTPEEDRVDAFTREHRFDIPMLGRRVAGAVGWASSRENDRPLGLFGASTGAAAALVAAAARPEAVGAVVSRGGRPDLADESLPRVEAPTLLVVGGEDHVVIDLNRRAADAMNADVELEIVPGAGHLFEEPGTLDIVAELAARWFRRHLAPGEQP